MNAAELLELAERCERATGPDRRLEIDILSALGLGVRIPGTAPDGSFDGWHNPYDDPCARKAWNCTSSLDSAKVLTNDAPFEVAFSSQNVVQHAAVWGNGAFWSSGGQTAPLALCAAALRARASTIGESA